MMIKKRNKHKDREDTLGVCSAVFELHSLRYVDTLPRKKLVYGHVRHYNPPCSSMSDTYKNWNIYLDKKKLYNMEYTRWTRTKYFTVHFTNLESTYICESHPNTYIYVQVKYTNIFKCTYIGVSSCLDIGRQPCPSMLVLESDTRFLYIDHRL